MSLQLEEESSELRRQLNQEKAARAIQEEMVNDQRRAQEIMQEVSDVCIEIVLKQYASFVSGQVYDRSFGFR